MTLKDVSWNHREGGKRVRAELICLKHNHSSTFYLKENCKEVKEILFHCCYKLNGNWTSENCIGEVKIFKEEK